MKTINTTTELRSINDLDGTWKIAAHEGAGKVPWVWCGELAEEKQNKLFRSMAFPDPKQQPHVSCCQGRTLSGKVALYARIFPVGLRGKK